MIQFDHNKPLDPSETDLKRVIRFSQIHYANETLSKNRHTMPSRLDFTCNKKCVCHILGLCALVITLSTFTGLYEITLENFTISDFKDNGSQRF